MEEKIKDDVEKTRRFGATTSARTSGWGRARRLMEGTVDEGLSNCSLVCVRKPGSSTRSGRRSSASSSAST
jgi:hypothetical protein